MHKKRSRFSLALLLPLVGCSSGITGLSDGGAHDLSGDQGSGGGPGSSQSILVDPTALRDVDILFVIDNSPSMAPKQKVLAAAIPQLISAIDTTSANYHIGIVSTDVGYNPQPTTGMTAPWNMLFACNTYSGDDGVLQNIPCTNRSLFGEAATACTTLCPDPRFVPTNGARFISKINGVTNVPSLMMAGKDLGPQLAFQCLAVLGDQGCGVEHPLESARRALDGHRPDNAGFNRRTSALAVIFLTDEDDCSVPLAQRGLLDPTTPNSMLAACTTATATPGVDGRCYNVDYRCIARDVTCNEPMNAVGTKTGCAERADSFLSPVSQYVSFLSGQQNPNLILGGIWTPTLLDNLNGNAAKDGRLVVGSTTAPTDSSGLNRARKTQAACYNPDPTLTTDSANGFFGQAQLRLSSFIRQFPAANVSESSVCDAANYGSALGKISSQIVNRLGASCFSKSLKMVSGAPVCTVGYIDAATPNATPTVPLPVCSASCCNYFATDSRPNAASDPTLSPNPHLTAELAACAADPDCYCAVPSAVNCPGGTVAGLWRKGNAAPLNGKFASFQCQL